MQQLIRSGAALRLLAILATSATLACDDDDSPNEILAPVSNSSNATAIHSGNAQTVARGPVSAPLVVKVLNSTGSIPNATVTWTIENGGTLSATSTTTDANGATQVTVTAGNTPIAYTITARTGTTAAVTFYMYVP
jgi:hypothetical protein